MSDSARRSALGSTLLWAAVLTIASCVGFVPGTELHVVLQSPPARVGDGIEEAVLVVEEVELVACARASSLNLRSLAPSIAHAHGAELPSTACDLRASPWHSLTTLFPAPNEYCGVRLHLGDDAQPAAWVRGTTVRSEPRRDLVLHFEVPMGLHAAVADELVIEYDPVQWMVSGDLDSAFALP